MTSDEPSPLPGRRRHRWRAGLVSLAALLMLAAQAPQRARSWASEILHKEGYVEPPRALAEAALAPNAGESRTSLRQTRKERDGQHDFDFEIGTWKTHLSRLLHPLTGSTTWVEYVGTTIVREVWNGRANLVELEVDGPAGHFEGLSLRLYNPQSRQWSLNFSNIKGGTLSQPAIGEFKDGRGEFFSQESFNDRAIFVRFVISAITPDSCRFEQSFSDDGGKTWEVNWIAIDTRVKDESDKKP